MPGPLQGVRIVEMAGIGPAPFAGMLLADLGAEVIRIDRREAVDLGLPNRGAVRFDVLARGRRSIALDLKSPRARQIALRLVAGADALIEGFRPGVMERLGLGPDACLACNPRLVYGRMTGYGQDGPLAARAGHDIDYIAIAGALHGIGRAGERPVPPLNLVGDFGGGGMFLAVGVLAALLSARGSGRGQVVDAAMVDGTAYLMGMFQGLVAQGVWRDVRGDNILDGAAPWYDTYETADGQYMAVGAIEGRFYRELIEGLGLSGEPLPDQHDRTGWPALRARFAEVFATRTRDAWAAVFADSDACVAPVLSIGEAPHHPHNVARGNFFERDGVMQPAPAPRFTQTPAKAGDAPVEPGAESTAILREAGFTPDEIAAFVADGVVGHEKSAGS